MGGKGGGSHVNPRSFLWVGERQRSSWQSQNLVVGGGERWGYHGSPNRPFLSFRQGFSRQSQSPICKGLGQGSHGSLRRWLWSGEAGLTWHFQTLVVG